MSGMTNIHPFPEGKTTATDAHEGKSELSEWRKISESLRVISSETGQIRGSFAKLVYKKYRRATAGLRRSFRRSPLAGLGAAAAVGAFYKALRRRH